MSDLSYIVVVVMVQVILSICTHFSLAWSVCLFV